MATRTTLARFVGTPSGVISAVLGTQTNESWSGTRFIATGVETLPDRSRQLRPRPAIRPADVALLVTNGDAAPVIATAARLPTATRVAIASAADEVPPSDAV